MNSGIVMEILQSSCLSEFGPKCNISRMTNVCFSVNVRSYHKSNLNTSRDFYFLTYPQPLPRTSNRRSIPLRRQLCASAP